MRKNILFVTVVSFLESVFGTNEYVGGVFYRTDSGLVEVPSDIPQEAVEVYLVENRITDLRTGTFSNLTRCHTLDIQNNAIATIEGDTFTGMTRIRTLNLHLNQLTFLQKSMFNGLASLTYLNIQSNLIESISDDCFSDLINLHNLYLGRNRLSEISGNTWQGLSNLKRLYLYSNNIDTLKPNDFDNLPKLGVLLLYLNPMTTFSYTIFNPSIYPKTDGHPKHISLGIGTLQCDKSLCWLKQGERLGWISWAQWIDTGDRHPPDCVNLPVLWSAVDLNCPNDGTFFHKL